jgi:hypothetical protein
VRVRHSPRTKLHARELEYVLAVSAQVSVYGPETSFAVPQRHGSTGRPRTVARPDRQPESVRALAARLPAKSMEDAAMPDDADRRGGVGPLCIRPESSPLTLSATTASRRGRNASIIEWPENEQAPTDYWLSNLPPKTRRERLARHARLRWTIELDYRPSRESLASTTTKDAAIAASITTAHSSPARTPSSRLNASTQKPAAV